jgi:carbonic anhydrase
VRNAGNLCGEKCAGTLDYAIHHLGIKLIVVMGHQGCGAVKASRLPTKAIMGESPKLKDMLLDMKRSLAYCSETLDKIQDPNARDREAVIANAQAQVKKILEDPGVHKKCAAGEIIVIAAFYEITSGIVDFVEVPLDKIVAA